MTALLDSIQKFFAGRFMSSDEQNPTPVDPPRTEPEGPLTSLEVELVQQSWAKVSPIADQAADLFYGRLFELDPSLRSMFPDDMSEQKKKLMTMIGVAVGGLTKLEEIVPAVQSLGKRHTGYGVKDEHYDTVGSALVWTLGQGLGEEFSPDVESAWIKVYTLLADTMKNAA